MAQKIKRTFQLLAILGALLVCAVGVWPTEYVMHGRDLVEGTGTGATPVVTGEDLLTGFAVTMLDRYPWPTAPVTLKAAGGAVADTGYVVVYGADSSYAEVTDSVQITGTDVKTFAGRWRYVQTAEYHDDSTNTAAIRIYHGYQIADSTLASIEVRQARSNQAIFMQPANRTRIVPMSARITYAYPGTAEVDGHVSILERKPNQAWHEKDGFNFFGDAGQVVFLYDPREAWEAPVGTQYSIAASVTPSNTRIDIDGRFKFGVQ